MADLLIRNIRPHGGHATDILIRDGHIADMRLGINVPGATVEEGNGALAVPGFVEAHAHLDKTLWGMPWHRHERDKTLKAMIDDERRLRHELDMDPERQSARNVVLCLSKGSTAIRSHVDIDTEHKLKILMGVLATRARYRDLVDIEIVAFPQSGMMIRPGTYELMDEALAAGADVVGGIDPCGVDRDPKGHLDAVFCLSQKHGKPIDIHLHERGELGAFTLDLILDRIKALGMHGKVTISHAFCLGRNDRTSVEAQLDRIAQLGVAIATTAPASRPVPSVAACLSRGITVCSGSDGIRDTWSPFGNADMLERAMLVAQRNDFRADDDLEIALGIVTEGGAKVMGLAEYGLAPGGRADIVLIDAETVPDAIVTRPPRRLVVSKGQVVASGGTVKMEAP